MDWSFLLAVVSFYLQTALSDVLRVETGHQEIAIDGRDPYMGYFTRIHFTIPTCVQSLTVHCLRPLTGAEEIDLLFSACERTHWKVAHYTNTKEEFRLKRSVMARQMMISSRHPLTIIDVQVASCSNSTVQRPVNCRSDVDHPRRHGRTGPLRASEYYNRRKRSIGSESTFTYGANTVTEFKEDRIVPRGSTVTVHPGATLRFHDDVGLIVHGALIAIGSKTAPIRFEAAGSKWKGIQILDGSPQSILRHVNISSSAAGLSVQGGVVPVIENVFSDSNDVGMKIQSNNSDVRIVRSYATNSLGPGFHFVGKAAVFLEECVAAGGRDHGIHVQGSKKLTISKTNSFTNARNGLYAKDVRAINIEDTVIDGNGAGIKIQKQTGASLDVQILRTNISSHHYGPGILLQDSSNTKFTFERSQLHDNYMGAISMEGEVSNSQISISNSNFSRNRGSTVSISLLSEGKIDISDNLFHGNQLNDYRESEAVLEIATGAQRKDDSSILIQHNQFTKNVMNDVIEIRRLTGVMVDTWINRCELLSNLARSIIFLKGMTAVVEENMLHNTQSTCEISTPSPSHYDSARNYWGYDRQSEILLRICATNESGSANAYNLDDNTATRPTVAPNPLPPLNNTYNLVKAVGIPYTIDQDVVIKSDETVIIEPGTHLVFAPGVQVTVQEKGKLLLNGTPSDPIRMDAQGGFTWKGVVVKPGGSLSLSDTSISDAQIGLWIDSDRVHLERARVERPVVHGVEITANAGSEVDLGDSVITGSGGSAAIAVDERKGNLSISNVFIENAATGAIDFISPSDFLELENIKIVGSGSHSIHISEFASTPLISVDVKNVTISDQIRGHAGLLITGGWIRRINVENFTAERNLVPSILIALECNDRPSLTSITNSTFKNNRDTVVSLQLGECGGLEMRRNRLEGNNKDGRAGVVRVDGQPKIGSDSSIRLDSNEFLRNQGDFTVFLSSDGEEKANGAFENNILEGNVNSGATVVVTSPSYAVKSNRFENPSTRYQLEARGDGSWILDAAGNAWGSTTEDDVVNMIKAPEGSVRVLPLLPLSPSSTSSTPSSSGIMTSLVTPPTTAQFEKCSHVNHCSYRGTCLEGLCLCPLGFVSADCSIEVGCKNNCSSNGLCNVFNVCHCYEGWTSPDCSIPICAFGCGGHGECVSKDECRCQPEWTGPFCLEPACSIDNCYHGTCREKKCVCQGDWKGKRCDVPSCSNCSLNGQCVSPEHCQCFEDFGGTDCSECIGPSCAACDLDCDHGTCEPATRTCTCSPGWSGAACDVCDSKCGVSRGNIQYLLPSTANVDDTNTVVSVFGSDLPRARSDRYTCIFGTHSTTGFRQSSSIIRCPLPSDMSPGRHLFNVAIGGDVIQPSDTRPLHFTLFEKCLPSSCSGGSCLGPLCLCPKGRTGRNCDIIELVPEIDHHFLKNQVANSAQEGTPYVVYLPAMPGTVLRVNSTVPNLHFDPIKGLLEWAEPIGRDRPYEITVLADSLAGESSISWNLTVVPSYTAKIDDVTSNGSRLLVKGTVGGVQNPTNLPVIIRLERDGSGDDVDSVTVTSDEKGRFTYEFIPKQDGSYAITASHPGQSGGSAENGKSIEVKSEELHMERSEERGPITIRSASTCTARLLGGVEGSAEVQKNGDSSIVKLTGLDNDKDSFLRIECGDQKEIGRVPAAKKADPPISDHPSSLVLQQKSNEKFKLIELTITTSRLSLSAPLSIRCSDGTQPNDVVASDPPLEHYREYSNGKRDLKLALRMDVSRPRNETLILVSDGKELLHIPYTVTSSKDLFAGDNFLMSICLQDEWLRAGSNPRASVASLSVTNLQHKKDATQNNVIVNGKAVSFWIPEGIYSITAISPAHQTMTRTLWLSPHNSSICLSMTSLYPITVAKNTDGFTVARIEKQTALPYLSFSPTSIKQSTTHVMVTVVGTRKGTISILDTDNDYVKLEPSVSTVSVNDSFWMHTSSKLHIDGAGADHQDCAARAISVPFVFVPDGTSDVIKSSSPLVIDNQNGKQTSDTICDGRTIMFTESGNAIPHSTVTRVQCDCAQGARARCRKKYRSASACGSAWSRISDDTVSLQVLATFLLLISDCREVGVTFKELDRAMRCVSSLESECPLNLRRKREFTDYGNETSSEMYAVDEDMMMNDGPASLIKHLSSMDSRVPLWMPPQMSGVFHALGMQSIGVAGLYSDFFRTIESVFPPDLMDTVARDDIDRLIVSIGDGSELGMAISQSEADTIHEKMLVAIWNDTVTAWNSGKESRSDDRGIRYADAKQLVATADRLKSFTRQNGGSDPFSVLHDYIGRLLATSGTPSEDCASAAVLITPSILHEGDSIQVKVLVTNTQTKPLSSPSLSYDIIRDDVLSPSASLVSNGIGINTMTPDGVLLPGASFETKWSRKIVLSKKLTSTAKYQAIIVLSFSVDGKATKQRLRTETIEIRPMRSLKVAYFLTPTLRSSLPFAAMASIMNIGYTPLSSVKVDGTNMVVGTQNASTNYHLDSMTVDGHSIGPSLSFEVGPIESGRSKTITYNVSADDPQASVRSLDLSLSVDGTVVPVEDGTTYIIRALAGDQGMNGLMVSFPEAETPLFFFRPDTGTIVNIVPIQYVTSNSADASNPERKIIVSSYYNTESRSFAGYLWGSMPMPDIPSHFELIKMTEKGQTIGTSKGRDRELRPITWIEGEGKSKKLHFIDSGSSSTSYQLSYEMVFADPAHYSVPSFDQSSYRIQIMPELWPSASAPIGQISATSRPGQELQYSLYAPDGSKIFSVDKLTGTLFLDSPVLPGKESCLVLEARDERGQTSRVPVAVNTGGPRGECVMFSTDGLTASYHEGEWSTVTPTAGTSFTGRYTEATSGWTDEVTVPSATPTSTATLSSTAPTTVTPTTEEPLPTPGEFTPIVVLPTDGWTLETTSSKEETTNDHVTSGSQGTASDVTIVTTPTMGTMTSDAQWTAFTTWETTTEPEQTTLPSLQTTSGIIDQTTSEAELTTITLQDETTTDAVTTTDNWDQTTIGDLETKQTTTEPLSTTEVIYTMSSEGSPSTVDHSLWTTTEISTAQFTDTMTESTIASWTDGSLTETTPSLTTTEIIYTVTPDTVLSSTVTTQPVTYTVTADHILSSTVTTPPVIYTVTPDALLSSTSEVTYTVTEDPHLSSIGPPIIIPTDSHGNVLTSTTSSDILTTSNQPEVTSSNIPTVPENPYFANACQKAGLPLWNLICELSKTVASKTG